MRNVQRLLTNSTGLGLYDVNIQTNLHFVQWRKHDEGTQNETFASLARVTLSLHHPVDSVKQYKASIKLPEQSSKTGRTSHWRKKMHNFEIAGLFYFNDGTKQFVS